MKTLRVVIGVTFLLAFLAGRDTTTVSPVDELILELSGSNDAPANIDEPRVDIYGNQVDQAVGDYRVDPRGDLYERHAPDTAVLELGPPSV